MKDYLELQIPKIKAIKIDVDKQLVYHIEIDNTLQAKYDAIGNDCRLIEVGAKFTHSNQLRSFKDVMYVDEESLLKFDTIEAQQQVGMFAILTGSGIQKFVGNAIIVGTSNEGDTESANVSIQAVRNRLAGFYKIYL